MANYTVYSKSLLLWHYIGFQYIKIKKHTFEQYDNYSEQVKKEIEIFEWEEMQINRKGK